MKQTKIKKITALLLSAVILVCMALGLGVSAVTADDITETAKIASVNVEHRGAMHLAFKVETESVPEGAAVGIMMWAPGVENYTASNKIWENYQLSDDGAGTKYYASMPISAKDISTEYQVAVVAKDGDSVTLLSKPVSQSISAWASEKLETATDEARINLYKKVIAYGKAAAAVLSK